MRRSTHAGASAGGGDGVPFAEPKKTFAGQQGLHSSDSLQQGWVLDEIYRLSHHHVSTTLKLETVFTVFIQELIQGSSHRKESGFEQIISVPTALAGS